MVTIKVTKKESNTWREIYVADTEKAMNEISHFFSDADLVGFGKRLNRGKIAELYYQFVLGLNPIFDKISSYDFIYLGKKVQFKYIGQNASPSATECIKEKGESHLKFVNRIMRYYKTCDLFMLTIENKITKLSKNNVTTLEPYDFKKILMLHKVKDGNKLRLRKTIVRSYINDME